MTERLEMMCKGPGGVVEIFTDIDDVTGELLNYRIAAEPGAKLRFMATEAGVRSEKAKPDHPRDKTIAAKPGQFATKNAEGAWRAPWGLSLESP